MNVKNRRLTAALRIGALANAVLGCLGFAFTASAMQPPAHADHALGTVHFPVSCTAPAQRDFDHALALLHHMTYPARWPIGAWP